MTMEEKEVERIKKQIDAMDHKQMAIKWRFAPSGDPIFRSDLPLFAYFERRFKEFGGMTPAISKEIGW